MIGSQTAQEDLRAEARQKTILRLAQDRLEAYKGSMLHEAFEQTKHMSLFPQAVLDCEPCIVFYCC